MLPEWLEDTLISQPMPWHQVFPRLVAALLLGLVVAGIHAAVTRTPGKVLSRSFLATLVLLSVLIALVTMVIGNSVARAFSLVGALSIVRFRTVVEDTRDTAFVIFAVVVGMGAGSGEVIAPLLCAPLVFVAGWLFRAPTLHPTEDRQTILSLRIAASLSTEELLRAPFERHLLGHRLTAMATARGGAALDVTYIVLPRSNQAMQALVVELSNLEGVQQVEMKDR